MGSIGDPYLVSVPTVGTAGPGFATSINSILQETINRLSVKVPVSSIDFNNDADFGGSSILNAANITLVNEAVSPVPAPSNRICTFGGDLWYVSPFGPIQITSGGVINVAGVNGITGDYGGANPAQLRFVDAEQRYTFYDNFGSNIFAFARARAFDIVSTVNSVMFLRLAFSGTASKTYTFPAAASTTQEMPLYINPSGQIIVGHGGRNHTFSAANFTSNNENTPIVFSGSAGVFSGARINTASLGCIGSLALDLPIGYAFTQVNVYHNKVTAAATAIRVFKQTTTGTAQLIASVSDTTTGIHTTPVGPFAAETVTTGTAYWLDYDFGTVAFQNVVGSVEVGGSMPA